MLLSDFLEELAISELSDLFMADNGEINPNDQAKVVVQINDVLSDLYTKYVIKTTDYTLSTAVKALNYTVPEANSVRIIYIMPIVPELETLYTNNDQFDLMGNRITFKKLPKADSFSLVLQYKPSRLSIRVNDPTFLTQEADIPSVLVPLVRTLVASNLFGNSNAELHKKTAVELFNKAQFMKAELEASGALVTTVGFRNNRFKLNGFV